MDIEIEKRPNGSRRIKMYCNQESLTRQEFKDDCDLAKTIARFTKTPDGLRSIEMSKSYVSERFDDVSNVVDYQVALNQVNAANQAFDRLPSILRKRFEHDPSKFLKFVDDPKNEAELRSLGLLKPKAESPVKPADAGTPPAGKGG